MYHKQGLSQDNRIGEKLQDIPTHWMKAKQENRKHTKHGHQNSQHQKKELSMNYTTPISSHGARNVSWDKGETSLTEGKKSQRSTAYADYMFFTKEGEIVDAEGRSRRKGLVTILTGMCKDCQYPFATVVPTKGGGSFAVDAFMRWLNELGWEKILLHVYGENSMGNLLDKVQEKMHGKVTVRRSPRYSPQSMAEGEMINGLLGGKIRTWLFDLNEKYAEKITPEHYLFPWIVRHSAWTLARFHVNKTRTRHTRSSRVVTV
jgi:hypothetical protein